MGSRESSGFGSPGSKKIFPGDKFESKSVIDDSFVEKSGFWRRSARTDKSDRFLKNERIVNAGQLARGVLFR